MIKEKEKYYIGCDIGSTSIKLVALNENTDLCYSSYVKNKGVIDGIKQAFKEFNLKADENDIAGFGITGSGRYFGGMLLKADLIKTEILAHAKASLHYHPEIKTIFEIGGEDCKIIIIENGKIKDFQMNTICGGGTGAMIEAIANRIDIPLEKIGDIALTSQNEIAIAGKCGIFAQSTVVSKINLGVNKNDILMGVCDALINNYFAMLAKGKNLKPPFMFQGATAFNKALVYCFEKETGHKIIVPPHPHLMGAIGMALYLIENKQNKTNFIGLKNINNNFKTINKRSNRCANHCEVTYLYDGNQFIGSFGNRCEGCAQPEN